MMRLRLGWSTTKSDMSQFLVVGGLLQSLSVVLVIRWWSCLMLVLQVGIRHTCLGSLVKWILVVWSLELWFEPNIEMTFLIFSFHGLVVIWRFGHSRSVTRVLKLSLLGRFKVVSENSVAVYFVQGEMWILKFCVIMLLKFLTCVRFKLLFSFGCMVSLTVST